MEFRPRRKYTSTPPFLVISDVCSDRLVVTTGRDLPAAGGRWPQSVHGWYLLRGMILPLLWAYS